MRRTLVDKTDHSKLARLVLHSELVDNNDFAGNRLYDSVCERFNPDFFSVRQKLNWRLKEIIKVYHGT